MAQIKFSIGRITDWHTGKVSISDGTKEVAYLDKDSCLHVIDSLGAINALIKLCLKQSRQMTKLDEEKDMLINLLKEYIKPAKYTKF